MKYRQRGVATFEMAILLPILVFLLLSGIGLYYYLRSAYIAERTTSTIAQMIADAAEIQCDGQDSTDSRHPVAYWELAKIMAGSLNIDGSSGGLEIRIFSDGISSSDPELRWASAFPAGRQASTDPLPSSTPFETGDVLVSVELQGTYAPLSLLASGPQLTAGSTFASVRAQSIVRARRSQTGIYSCE